MNKRKAIEDLVLDEVEAINGYQKLRSNFSSAEQKTIDKIINDEKEHVKLLLAMTKEER